MSTHKALNAMISVLMIASLLLGATTQASAKQVSVREVQNSVVAAGASSMPTSETDETKVPHYFGPWPNWANSPFTLPNATVDIQGDGSGATAVAQVDPVTGGIASIQVTSPGSGYTAANVVINGGNGDATATAIVNTSGVVTSVTVDPPGVGYVGYTAPTVSFSGGGATMDATGTAYGGVYQVIITNQGFGYSMPTLEFDLPDAPDGIVAKAHVASTALGDPSDGMDGSGRILTDGIIVDEPGSGYLTPPHVTIHNGTVFDPISGATPATAETTLQITSVVLDTFGSGYTSAPAVTFSDMTGTGAGAVATASVDVGGVTRIDMVNAGTGYLTVGMRKFIDNLPGLCDPSGVAAPVCPTSGKYIPLAVPELKTYNGIEADEYVIGVIQYRTSFSSDLPDTLVRGYVQINLGSITGSQDVPLMNTVRRPDPANPGQYMDVQEPTGYVGVTPPQWLGPVIAATKNKPVRIVFRNLLPNDADGDLFLPVDSTFMGSGMGPMPMDPPMDESSVMDMVRNPMCGEYPKGMGCFKDNRATLHLHGGITPWISDGTPHQWITPANEMTDYPQGVSVVDVPDMNVCQANDDGCQTFYYTNQQSARLLFYHDHSWGITRLNVYAGEAAGYLISDATEQALISSGAIPADQIPLIVQDRTFVPDAAQLALQDPTWDPTRWGTKGNFWYHHVYMPAQNPGDPSGMSAYGRWMYGPWFWPPAADTVYGPIPNPYYEPNCNIDDPGTWQYDTDPYCEPQEIPGTPNISAGMEQFNDTPIVNGVAYPKVTLEPKAYRFRMLNAANDRFFNFQWYVADPTQGNGLTEVALKAEELAAAQTDPVVSPTPDTMISLPGPDWIQIGTEGGFLPAPVVVDGQQVTTWITDPTRFDVGNVDQHSLLLAPAERADVIVDFRNFAGKTLILYNDAPAAFPARIPSYDYYTGAPDLSPVGAPTILPGYGPNTRTIMQVTISGTPALSAFNLTKLQNAFRHNASSTGAFESGQHGIIVGQAGYNSAYGTSFAASSNCNAPGTSVQRCDGFVRVNDTMSFGFNTLRAPTVKTTMPLQPKAIHDETNATTFDEFGRMQANLGVEAQPPTPGQQNVTLYPFVNPQTELIDATNLPKVDVIYDTNGRPVGDVKIAPLGDAGDGTQLWRITHNGVDTHPIHFHLYDVQLLNRVTWDNIIIPPDATELGWKDTIRVSPLEDTIVALRPIIPELPFEVPNSIRMLNPMMMEGSDAMFNNIDPQGNPTDPIMNQLVNFGWEYVYHCHILSHEEMDMMRPVSVAMPPIKPSIVSFDEGTGILSWNDNSITETSFVVQKATTPNVWEDVYIVDSPLDALNVKNVTLSYTDADFVVGTPYDYRVVAKNTIGYGGAFPSMTVQSVSDVLHVGPDMPPSVISIERASPNPSSAPSVDFKVTFSTPVTGVDLPDFIPLSSGTISGPSVASISPASGPAAVYTVKVNVGTGTGLLGLDLWDDDTIIDAVSNPLGGVGVRDAQNPTPPVPGDGSFSSGLIYTIDYTPPRVVSSVRLNANPTALSAVSYRVTFSETVTGVDKTDFTLTTVGMTGSSVASVTGTGATRTVKVNVGAGSGTLRLDVVDNDTIKDALFVPLGGVGAGNGSYTVGQVYSTDRLPPTVSSSALLDPSPTVHGTVRFSITFSETVTGVDPTDFNLITTGTIAGASVTGVTGSGANYTVAINTGSGSGTIQLRLVDNDSIKDALNYPLGGAGAGNGNYTTPQIYEINPVPVVLSIGLLSSSPTNTASVSYLVTFSEPVTGVDLSAPFNDFFITASGVNNPAVTSVAADPTGTAFTVLVDTGTGDGTLRLDIRDNDTIIDATGNPLAGAGVFGDLTGDGSFNGQSYGIDKTAPTVSIARASASPTGAASVDYIVTFSEPVTGVGMAAPFADFVLTATSGIVGESITGVTGSLAAYTVTVNTGNGNGTLSLNMSGSTSIADPAGNLLAGVPLANGVDYALEKTPPTVQSIGLASPNPTNAATVNFLVTFSEPVTGVDTATFSDFALAPNGISGATIMSVAPADQTGASYTVVVNNISGSGTLGLNVVDHDTILNGFNIPLGGTGTGATGNGSFTGQAYDIDTIPPTVTSIVPASPNPTSAASVTYRVTFSEVVTGLNPTDFALAPGSIADTSVTSVSPADGTGMIYNVAVNTGTGNGTVSLDLPGTASITDMLGNSLVVPFASGVSYTIDKTPPLVSSILRDLASPTNAASVTYTVTFSEPVTGVDLSAPFNDFALVGIGDAAVTSVSGSGTTYTVAVNTGTGSGTLRLDVPASAVVTDLAGNALAGLPFSGGQSYTVVPSAGTYDDTHPNWVYTGAWTSVNTTGPYNGTDHYSNDLTATASFMFSGSGFSFRYIKAPNRGNIDVWIDGVKVATINAYSASLIWQAVYTKNGLANGIHTVVFKHGGPGGRFIDIDAIQILVPPTPVPAGTYDDSDLSWVYTGAWTSVNTTGPYNGTDHYSNDLTATATLTFTGTGFDFKYIKAPNRGNIDVWIDGVKVATINAYSPTLTWQSVYSHTGLSAGTHTVQFVNANSSAAAYIDIDAITITP